MRPTRDYNTFLLEELRDPEIAAAYLSAAILSVSIENGELEEFLIALRNVAEAHGKFEALSANQQSVYKTLFHDENPRLTTFLDVLKAVGISVTFTPSEKDTA